MKMESHNQHDMLMSVSKNKMRIKVINYFNENRKAFNFKQYLMIQVAHFYIPNI